LSLNDKQQKFVREYLVDFNATQAAIRSGYSPRTARNQASDLLAKPDIQALLKEYRDRAAEQTQTDINWVRQRLKEEATDYSEFASHSARIKAIEVIARLNGDFEKDNNQKAPLVGTVRLVPLSRPEQDDDER